MTTTLNERPARGAEMAAKARRAGIEFMLTDLEVALTLLERSETTTDAATVQGTVRAAHRALDVVEGFMDRMELDHEQRARLYSRRAEVRSRLAHIGLA